MKKLLHKTNRYVVFLSLGILLAGSIAVYFSIIYMVDAQITEHLSFEQKKVEMQLKNGENFSAIELNVGDKIHVDTLATFFQNHSYTRDTTLFDVSEQEQIPYRQLIFPISINGKKSTITISKSLLETEDFVEGIVIIVVSIAFILVLALFWMNRWVSKKVWAPFYRTLAELQAFDIHKSGKINFETSDILEFSELNNAVGKMTAKMFSDYINLKEFTENASHEIQTPLAIIIGRLELFLQSENLSQEQSRQIQGAYEATIRLSKLNQGLVLLTRIENRQYKDSEKISIGKIIEERILALNDFIAKRNLQIKLDLEHEKWITMNAELATILINNLIGNAIKHNV
ncbi:MAG: HAMP domain-containing sensor histidine kinase, partial [Bacteroidia bacterium]